MADISWDTAKLRAGASRFEALGEDAFTIHNYWGQYGVPLCARANQGIPGKVLQSTYRLGAPINSVAKSLRSLQVDVATALRSSATLYDRKKQEDLDEIKQIWGHVDTRGHDPSDGINLPASDFTPLPSTLRSAPVPADAATWAKASELANIGTDTAKSLVYWDLFDRITGLNSKGAFFSWVNNYAIGDWQALGSVSDILRQIGKSVEATGVSMSRDIRIVRSNAQWTGPSADLARDRVQAASARVVPVANEFYRAQATYEAWAGFCRVSVDMLTATVSALFGKLGRANKVLRDLGDVLPAILAGKVITIAQTEERARALAALRELFDLAVGIAADLCALVNGAQWILRAYVMVTATFTALAQSANSVKGEL